MMNDDDDHHHLHSSPYLKSSTIIQTTSTPTMTTLITIIPSQMSTIRARPAAYLVGEQGGCIGNTANMTKIPQPADDNDMIDTSMTIMCDGFSQPPPQHKQPQPQQQQQCVDIMTSIMPALTPSPNLLSQPSVPGLNNLQHDALLQLYKHNPILNRPKFPKRPLHMKADKRVEVVPAQDEYNIQKGDVGQSDDINNDEEENEEGNCRLNRPYHNHISIDPTCKSATTSTTNSHKIHFKQSVQLNDPRFTISIPTIPTTTTITTTTTPSSTSHHIISQHVNISNISNISNTDTSTMMLDDTPYSRLNPPLPLPPARGQREIVGRTNIISSHIFSTANKL